MRPARATRSERPPALTSIRNSRLRRIELRSVAPSLYVRVSASLHITWNNNNQSFHQRASLSLRRTPLPRRPALHISTCAAMAAGPATTKEPDQDGFSTL